jgi:drug/metabolite transporter (DMT)-like permease
MKRTATLVGFAAILMWAFFALFSFSAGAIPPFQLTAMSFLIASFFGMIKWIFVPESIKQLKQGWRVWVVGVGGLFGFHAVYFTAIQSAPPVEVSLIAYLWPLLIVVFSSFLPGEKLKLHHIIGVVFGFLGAVLLISRGELAGLLTNFSIGHILAIACALIWSTYSVLSRRLAHAPTDVVVGFCLATAVLSMLIHLAFETTIWPSTTLQWLAILGLGIFPVGIAFYAWDYGVKRGDIMVLGAASYGAPLLSTLVLLGAGLSPFHWSIAVACLFITGGAVIAAKDMFFKQQS